MTAEVLRHLRDGGLVFTFGATTTRVCVFCCSSAGTAVFVLLGARMRQMRICCSA